MIALPVSPTMAVSHTLPAWLLLPIVLLAFAATSQPTPRQRRMIGAVLVAVGFGGMVFAGDLICVGCDRCYGLDPSSFWYWYYGCFLP